jgi:hypothetical protein
MNKNMMINTRAPPEEKTKDALVQSYMYQEFTLYTHMQNTHRTDGDEMEITFLHLTASSGDVDAGMPMYQSLDQMYSSSEIPRCQDGGLSGC